MWFCLLLRGGNKHFLQPLFMDCSITFFFFFFFLIRQSWKFMRLAQHVRSLFFRSFNVFLLNDQNSKVHFVIYSLFSVTKIPEKEKITDAFKLFRRYDGNVSATKNGIPQRLWIGHGRTRYACHASGRQPIISIGRKTVENAPAKPKSLSTLWSWASRFKPRTCVANPCLCAGGGGVVVTRSLGA